MHLVEGAPVTCSSPCRLLLCWRTPVDSNCGGLCSILFCGTLYIPAGRRAGCSSQHHPLEGAHPLHGKRLEARTVAGRWCVFLFAALWLWSWAGDACACLQADAWAPSEHVHAITVTQTFLPSPADTNSDLQGSVDMADGYAHVRTHEHVHP